MTDMMRSFELFQPASLSEASSTTFFATSVESSLSTPMIVAEIPKSSIGDWQLVVKIVRFVTKI